MRTDQRPELDELFHQPVRLEIMAELCSTSEGRSFTDLREKCGLTDGNLSRHLQSLTQAGAIKIKKSFVKSRPLTSISVTSRGRDSFLRYLDALDDVLRDASNRANAGVKGKERQVVGALPKPVRG